MCVPVDYATRKSRRYKNTPQTMKKILIAFLISFAILASYVVVEYSLYVEYRRRAVDLIPVYNRTIRLTGSAYVMLNIQREYFRNETEIVNGQTAEKQYMDYVDNLQDNLKGLETVLPPMLQFPIAETVPRGHRGLLSV
ncbi:MAG: hypothetical protein P4M11_11150 [Candidatus Pacebacteria bacterium]|nr:hypothetical protein [Candidatus Paceibacterota bacterium]